MNVTTAYLVNYSIYRVVTRREPKFVLEATSFPVSCRQLSVFEFSIFMRHIHSQCQSLLDHSLQTWLPGASVVRWHCFQSSYYSPCLGVTAIDSSLHALNPGRIS